MKGTRQEKSVFKTRYNDMIKQKNQRGITLLALVITIIIIIILATVAISFLFGENGLITRAQQAKLEQEIATARETLTMILGDAFVEKKINPEYDQNEFLDEFIKERKPKVYLEEDEIGLDGHVFSLNRSVPELGKYIGEQTGPRIKEIKVTGETTNSVSIEVLTVNATGAEYTYSYKKDSEGEESWQEVETTNNNTCTIRGLQQGETYNIKVVVTTNKGEVEGIINVYLGEIPTGTITFTNLNWVGDGTASVQINTTAVGYRIRYKIDSGEWIETTNGGTISNLQHGNTVYGQLWDGTNNSGEEDATVTIEDDIPPTISNITTSVTENSITVNVTASDNESGIATYTYALTGGATASNQASNTHTFAGLNSSTPYTIQVTVTDKAGQTVQDSTQATTETSVPSTVAEAKEEGTTFTDTTPLKDDLGNTVYIPGGFHVDKEDSGTKVEEGIVIEDDTENQNQFVWIPTGEYNVTNEVDSDGEKDGKMTNELSRRTFTSSGATIVIGDNVMDRYYYGEGDSRSVAKDQIVAFKTSATTNGGFYIGRYEQGTGNVCKAGVDAYVDVTRDTAKEQAESMYSGNSEIKATTELISSYAWDTALNFICQTNTEGYTLVTTTSSSYANIGTSNKTQTGAYAADNYSNIHDLLGNCREWTTEYSSDGRDPCVVRGGGYYHFIPYAAIRDNEITSTSGVYISFRSQLYVA